MANERKGSKKVVVYLHPDGVIFIQPTTRGENGKHRIKSGIVKYSNVKESSSEFGEKVREMFEKCD